MTAPTAGELAVLARRVDALELALRRYDERRVKARWADVAFAFEQVHSTTARLNGTRDRLYDLRRTLTDLVVVTDKALP